MEDSEDYGKTGSDNINQFDLFKDFCACMIKLESQILLNQWTNLHEDRTRIAIMDNIIVARRARQPRNLINY